IATYFFAKVGDASAGGASFTTDTSGIGPNDAANWGAANYFSGLYYYRTGASWGGSTSSPWSGSSDGNTCGGMSTGSSGALGVYGLSTTVDTHRWAFQNTSCDISQPIICFVNP